jgi:formylglycine-generating enzyme required for sulfatase activity
MARAASAVAIAIVLGSVAVAVALGMSLGDKRDGARCGAGFVAHAGRCVVPGGTCPTPLVATAHGCDASDARIAFTATSISVGPSDWEAEGRVPPRSIHVSAFRIGALEVTRGRWAGPAGAADGDSARAASGMTRDEASAFCALSGGRLPTEEEWTVAAASAQNPPHRYPWGDTGAVCRRAAWGLRSGPCALGSDEADTVGAHPDGNSPLGMSDLAGNVAEWVAPDRDHPELGVAKGGSWESALASDLRIWARLELPPSSRDRRVGVRCAYPP